MGTPNIAFHTHTALAEGLKELLKQLEDRLALATPLTMYLAEGMAVHLYTAARVTTAVDAEYSARVNIPDDVMVTVNLEDGTPQVIYLDKNYNASFALMHEDYQHDSVPVNLGRLQHVAVRVLQPVDLAVSKIARLANNDREDIASLVRLGLTNADEIEQRATAAIAGFVGGRSSLLLNLKDALSLARNIQTDRDRDTQR